MEYVQSAVSDIVHAIERRAVFIVGASIGVGVFCYVVWKRKR